MSADFKITGNYTPPQRKAGPTSFKAGNKAAVGAKHAGRRFLTQQLVSILHEIEKDRVVNPASKTNVRRVLEALVQNAIGGDVVAVKEIFDRVEGRPVQAIMTLGEEEKQDFIKQMEALTSMDTDGLTALYRATVSTTTRIDDGSSSSSH